ncbi:MAG: 30S ribosomal protein S12 methylthiotransferase RimO [Clostridia bacterium]|nr:30S ribosomal protein S12 methylthiotransferase RimO [Clostridia bacterium]MBQ6678117.1 30S ribosomal protein S12 methylthiotransferase RimO [Clostridia bacterium]
MSSKKIAFVSLGCAKNLCDTEVMLGKLAAAGFDIVPEAEGADAVVVNTCAFIEEAKRESIDTVLDLAWLKEHHSLKALIVTGCMAERYREELLSEMPEIDAIVGVGSLDRIVEAVSSALGGERGFAALDPKETCALGGDRIVTTGDAMAYIKIAEGCSNRCAYCAIPSIRGPLRSRRIEDIVAEARDLDAMGVKELNVIAQDTSAYGIDLYGKYELPKLINEITKQTRIPWIRLLYCYPDKITDELVALIRDNDRVVKYIDIPIQHISDPVLRRMNRHGDAAMIKDAVRRLREAVPDIVLRTTLIVGFPGETDADFEELCRFVKEAGFDRLGAFTYSREEDTPAYSMEEQVSEEIKQKRYDILMKTQLRISEKKMRERVGRVYPVLCESFDPVAEAYVGRTPAEAPDVDGKVFFTSSRPVSEGEITDVKITDSMDYDMVGETVV